MRLLSSQTTQQAFLCKKAALLGGSSLQIAGIWKEKFQRTFYFTNDQAETVV